MLSAKKKKEGWQVGGVNLALSKYSKKNKVQQQIFKKKEGWRVGVLI